MPKRAPKRPFEKWEDQFLMANFEHHTQKEIATQLGRHPSSVRERILLLLKAQEEGREVSMPQVPLREQLDDLEKEKQVVNHRRFAGWIDQRFDLAWVVTAGRKQKIS